MTAATLVTQARDDVVTDIWPIIPRGPGHRGLGDRPVAA